MSMRNKHNKHILIIAIAMLPFLVLSAFGQSSASMLGGSVLDPSKAVMPGVSVVATNIDTGVETTTLTNNAGKYNFPSLQPGLYKVAAELQGFNKAVKTDVKIGISNNYTVNFDMQVAGSKEIVTVTTSMANQIIETSASTGTVMSSQSVTQLPLVSNDVLDLINIMGGTIKPDNPIFGNSDQAFAGVAASNVNLQRDGVTITEVRYQSGIVSASRLNTESVAEFKMILSPVDAELGRGMGQVQILTKSGSNAYHGSGVWNFQNTTLDANEFQNNRITTPATKPDWRNYNNYILSANGPIKRNKTFFFVTYDQAISRSKTSSYPMTLTPCAKKGIFRYFNGWNSGNIQQITPSGLATTTPIRAVVDPRGTPLDAKYAGSLMPGYSPITTAPNGTDPSSLKYASVIGVLDATAKAQVESDLINCSNYDPWTRLGVANSTDYYDSYRKLDTSGYIQRFNDILLPVNNYEYGDGLNSATYKFNRGNHGSDTVYGSGEDNNRKNITAKIDHNLSDRHRLSGTFTYETNASGDARNVWPENMNGYSGTVNRKPKSGTLSATSTLRPTLLNEVRFGFSETLTHTNNPLDNPDTGKDLEAFMQKLLPTDNFPNFKGKPLLFGPGSASGMYWGMGNGMIDFGPNSGSGMKSGASTFFGGSRGSLVATFGGTDHRWTVADTITWTKGVHSFKFGGEVRLTRSNQDSNGDQSVFFSQPYTSPVAFGGVMPNSSQAQFNWTTYKTQSIFDGVVNAGAKVSGLVGAPGFMALGGNSGYYDYSTGTYKQIQDLQTYMSASVGAIQQYFFVNSPSAVWNDPSKGELSQNIDIRQREFSFFAKDDWRVSPSLTLNLGVRYEYYGIPWVESGMTMGLQGGSNSLFGISGKDFSNWLAPNPVQYDSSYQTKQQFVGPNSPNPTMKPWNKDMNNLGPAVGFAWQLPWFGKGKTTIRGGYQMSFTTLGNAGTFANVIGSVTGTSYSMLYTGNTTQKYATVADLPNLVPLTPNVKPLSTITAPGNRAVSLSAWDPNIRTPYIQSINLSLSRNFSSSLSAEVRYIGTLSRKQTGSIDLNSVNWLHNGLKEAFDAARKGGTSPLLDRIFKGIQFSGVGTGTGVGKAVGSSADAPTGGDVLRSIAATGLANGDYNTVASNLYNQNYTKNATLNTGLADTASQPAYGGVLRANGFPENFIYANPQLSSANWNSNINHQNYHSMQATLSVRPTRGFSTNLSYTFAKGLGDTTGWADPTNRSAEYTWTASSRAQQLNMYGSLSLPFGQNGVLFRNVTSPVLKRVMEGWDISWILTLQSGKRASIGDAFAQMMGGTNSPDYVAQAGVFDPRNNGTYFPAGAYTGSYFGTKLVTVKDPQCTDETLLYKSLASSCTLTAQALANADGTASNTIVYRQSLPGTNGNVGKNTFEGVGVFSLDMNMGKNVVLTEGKSLNIRIDAQNVLNHPTPSNSTSGVVNARYTQISDPNFTFSTSNQLGYIASKGGHRTFQGKIRLQF